MGHFQRLLVRIVVGVVHFPKLTLAICAAVLVASVSFALLHLQLSTDEDALLTPMLAFFRQYKQFEDEFPENDAFVLILQPRSYEHPPTAARWIDYADQLTAELSALKDIVVRVDSHTSPESLGAQGMLFDDWDDIREQSTHSGDFVKFAHIAGDPNSGESIGLSLTSGSLLAGTSMTQRVLGALSHEKPEDTAPMATEVMRTLANAIASKQPFSEWTTASELPSLARADPQAASDPRELGYNMVNDETKRNDPQAYKTQRILVISISTKPNDSSLSALTKPLDRMRSVVAKVAASFPDFQPPVITGRAAMQVDQMRTSDHDTRLAEICGLSLVFLALYLFLRNLWMAIVAELCLGVGIGWTFGWATLAVGRLNLLSLVFVIALIGIGMDYLIQILMRYRFEKNRARGPDALWAGVFTFISPPISTACAGAAAAFLVAMLTDFHGAAELGLIAGGGLLLCLAAGYTVLPAMLTLFPATIKGAPDSRQAIDAPPKAGGVRLLPVAIWILVAGAGLLVALPPHFDPNLIKLQDEDLPSVEKVHELQTWSAVILSPDLAKLRAARDAIAALPTVDHTESLLDAYDKGAWLQAHNGSIMNVSWHAPAPPTLAQLDLIASQADKLAAQWEKLPKTGGQVEDVSGVLAAARALAAAVHDSSIAPANKLARAAEWQRRFVDEVRTNVEQFAPPPVDAATLPVSLRNHLISVNTPVPVYALYIYPREDLWNFANLEPFVKDLEGRIDAFKKASGSDVVLTGIAPQLYHSTNEIQRAFLHSTLYALIAVILLVLLDMRSLVHTLLAVSVLLLGLPMLLLFMYIWRTWLHEPFGILGSWNLANFFALPILIGAGHEYGVFMVHRYRESLQDPRRVWRPWDVSDRALLLCGIVTSFSFGFLVFARHHGLQSLGWVMAVGTACIYLSAALVLRPILVWMLTMKKDYASRSNKEQAKSEIWLANVDKFNDAHS